MVNVNLHSQKPLTRMEMGLVTSMLVTMINNPDHYENKEPIISNGLTVTKKELDGNGHEVASDTKQISREEFVAAVTKAMNSTIEITIHTDTGEEKRSVPLMPVTLVDMPILKTASITLDEVPDFVPQYKNGSLGFTFSGELLDFILQDIDESQEEED